MKFGSKSILLIATSPFPHKKKHHPPTHTHTRTPQDPAAFRSVHLGGAGQARIVQEAADKERAAWAAKVVVADTSFKVRVGRGGGLLAHVWGECVEFGVGC